MDLEFYRERLEMNKLFKEGKELCAVEECEFFQGEQKVNYLKPVGGAPRIRIPVKKDVDRVTFVTSICPELRSKHELRGDEGNIMSIIIKRTNYELKQNQFFVEAVIC